MRRVNRHLQRAAGGQAGAGDHGVGKGAARHQFGHQNIRVPFCAGPQKLDSIRVVHLAQHLDLGPKVAERDVGGGFENFGGDRGAVPEGAVDDTKFALPQFVAQDEGGGFDLPVGVEMQARGEEVGDSREGGGGEVDELKKGER